MLYLLFDKVKYIGKDNGIVGENRQRNGKEGTPEQIKKVHVF